MRKKLFSLFIVLLLLINAFALEMANPLGPTLIPIAALLGNKIQSDTQIVFWKNPEEAIAFLAKKEVDMIVLPVTMGSNLYNKGFNIKLLGIYEWKVFYLVASNDAQFDDLTSLKGKSVYTPHGRGQTVDILLRFLLKRAGLEPDKDVKILYAPPQEIVALFKAGKVKYAAMPEPFATVCIAGNKGRIVLDFQKVWGTIFALPERIPIAGLFVRDEILKDKAREVEEFVKEFKESIEWSNKNPDEAIKIISKWLPLPAPVVKASLKRILFDYVPSSKSWREADFFLTMMHMLYPDGIPKIPDEEFYVK